MPKTMAGAVAQADRIKWNGLRSAIQAGGEDGRAVALDLLRSTAWCIRIVPVRPGRDTESFELRISHYSTAQWHAIEAALGAIGVAAGTPYQKQRSRRRDRILPVYRKDSILRFVRALAPWDQKLAYRVEQSIKRPAALAVPA